MAEEETSFYVKAITDYYGAAADELDLVEGNVYQIVQKTDSGWWFALDAEGIDGWIPSNYVNVVSQSEQVELAAAHRKKAEEEAAKQADLAAKGAYAFAPDEQLDLLSDDEKGGASNRMKLEMLKAANNFRSRQELKHKANDGDENAKKEFNKLEQERLARQKQNAATNQYKGRKDRVQSKDKSFSNKQWKKEDEQKTANAQPKWKHDEQLKKEERLRPKMFEELSLEERTKFDQHRPKLTSIQLPDASMNTTDYSAKAMAQWTVPEILHYLTINADSKNTFELKSVVGCLQKKAQINEGPREDILKSNGLNILLNLLACGGDSDVAVSMSCCKAIQILCESPVSNKYPAEKAACFYLTTAIRNSRLNPIFCYTAFNCLCNFVKGNDVHRNYLLEDEYSEKVVGYIIEGMNKFRYSDQDVTRNHHCEKVQISACLALQNLAASPRGRELIGNEGVEAVLDGFIAQVESNDVCAAAMGTLINLCASEQSAAHFIQNDGLNYLLSYLQNPHDDDDQTQTNQIKVTICRILTNIALEASTAETLLQREELDDVVTSLLIDAEYATELFFEIVKFVFALVHPLQIKVGGGYRQNVNQLMKNLNERNLFNILVDALEMDYEVDLGKNESILSGINAKIAAIISAYVLNQDQDVKNIIFGEADIDDPESFIPSKLIQASFATPSPSLTHHTNLIFFNCLDAPVNGLVIRNILIAVGLMDYLLENTAWYRDSNVSDDAITLGCGIVVQYLDIWYKDHQKFSINNPLECDWDLAKYQPLIVQLNAYVKKERVPKTKSDKLRQIQGSLEQYCKAIPVLLRKF